jgi:hypothetical protein
MTRTQGNVTQGNPRGVISSKKAHKTGKQSNPAVLDNRPAFLKGRENCEETWQVWKMWTNEPEKKHTIKI